MNWFDAKNGNDDCIVLVSMGWGVFGAIGEEGAFASKLGSGLAAFLCSLVIS